MKITIVLIRTFPMARDEKPGSDIVRGTADSSSASDFRIVRSKDFGS